MASTTAARGQTYTHDEARPASLWWIVVISAYVLIIALALAVRLMTFERFLPVLDHYDESLRFLHAYQIRSDAPLGLSYGQITWDEGFPPVQPWVGSMAQRVVERFIPFPYPSDYVYGTRLVSVAGGVLTALMLLFIGWMIARPLGRTPAALMGALAAVPWALSPQIVETGNFALIDPLIYPTVTAALLFTVMSIRHDSGWAAVASLALVILAIYEKYILIYALWFPACAVAVMLWRRGWRATLPWVGGMAALSAATAYWLLFVHRALSLENTEAARFRDNGIANMFSPYRNFDNLTHTIEKTMGSGVFWVVLLAGIIAYFISRRRAQPTLEARWLLVLIPYIIGCTLLTSSVNLISQTEPYWHRIRYMLPVAMTMIVIWSGALTQLSLTVWHNMRGSSLRTGLSAVLVSGAALWFAVPAVMGNLSNAAYFKQPHSLAQLWNWSDASLSNPEGKILMSGGTKIKSAWNRPWSGYKGVTTFEWVYDDNPAQHSPEYYVTEANAAYFVATEDDLNGVFNTPEMQAFIDELMLLKVLEPAAVDPFITYIYRLMPPDVSTNAVFGTENIHLVGYDLNATTLTGGDVISLRPFWQAESEPRTNYSMFIHLLPAGEAEPVTQFDGPPVPASRLPVTWTDPNETLIGTEAQIALPGDIPAGDYVLSLGLYDFETGARLTLEDGADHFEIPITIE